MGIVPLEISPAGKAGQVEMPAARRAARFVPARRSQVSVPESGDEVGEGAGPGPGDPTAVAERARKGRGAGINPSGRFEPHAREAMDDGWGGADEPQPIRTEVTPEKARSIITRNDSPDIAFDRSVNVYRGCEHGCVYCYARPSHSYLGLSPGLDFETKLFSKPDAARLLEREISAPGYHPKAIAMGTNTDPYQPVERQLGLTRAVLEVLDAANHPVTIVTKSAGVLRDLDILSRMAARGLAKVALSVTTLDGKLARSMEPRAATPGRRLEAIRQLSEAGVPTGVMVAPIIPALTDHEIERILDAAAEAGAREAGFVMLRLPHEVADIFKDWLVRDHPDRFRHVMNLVKAMREGAENEASFGKRMTGSGPYAWTIGRRFELAARRLGLNKRRAKLRTDLFRPPSGAGVQLSLF
ncbi:PA0069 family radical SAM protein [Segnochrobactraceae bacterium EtOH-i3]